MEVSLLKRIKCFPSTLRWKNWKTRSSANYRDVIVFETLRFQNVFRPHENEEQASTKFVQFEKRFSKAAFLRRIGRAVKLNLRF